MAPQSLYATLVNESKVFVSNYPIDGNDFMKDQTLVLYDLIQGLVTNSVTLALEEDPSSNPL
jgi:hypothetical protein